MDEEDEAETVEDPFVPGTKIQWAWDSTSLGYFKTCPRLYQYAIIEGWRPKAESIHLRFGLELHSGLQTYHLNAARGYSHDECVFHAVREVMISSWGWEVDEDSKAGKLKNRQSLIRTLIGYLDQYENDPARTHVKEDGEAAVELSFRFELDHGPSADSEGRPYTLCGHLDRIVEFNGELFDMDYKTTTSQPNSYYFDQYDPHNQVSLYSLAAHIILDAPVKGVIIDAIQILVDSTRSVRGISYRTDATLDEWLEDFAFYATLAEWYAEQDHWPMNDTACGMYGGCRFRSVCSKSPGVREKFLVGDFEKAERWNPLKPR